MTDPTITTEEARRWARRWSESRMPAGSRMSSLHLSDANRARLFAWVRQHTDGVALPDRLWTVSMMGLDLDLGLDDVLALCKEAGAWS